MAGAAIVVDGASIDNLFDKSNYTKNTVTGSGGAIYIKDGEDTVIANSTFTNNSAPSAYGGAIYSISSVTIWNNNFLYNTAITLHFTS